MKTIRKHTCSYLYTDGTLVQAFEEERDGVKIGETVDITLNYCRVDMRRYMEEGGAQHCPIGRIVFHQRYSEMKGVVEMARGGRIQASVPSICNGSPNTQEKRLAVQYLTLKTANGFEFHWTETPTILSSQFTIQDEASAGELVKPDEMYKGKLWGGYARVWKITDLRVKTAVAA